MLTTEELERRWQSLTFTDDFIFSQVMHDESICRQVVELILGVQIGEIRYLSAQDEHKTDPDTMGIIMDVFLRDEKRIINVEVQTGHRKELPKRSRYYQSVADASTTSTGSKYRNLPDNILIFICTFDPFLLGLPRYTFEFTCLETRHQLRLEDGALRIFLNTRTKALLDLDQKLQAFYHYLQEGTAESTLTKEISSKIRTLKNNSLARRHYMTLALKMADIRYDAFEEGLEQGREDGFQVGFQDGVAKGIEQGIKRGIEKGIEQGIERGAYQKALETARSMLCEGLDPQMVARCTNLPLDVVQELAQTK